MSIHPTAVISSQAVVDPSASIGAFCVIEGEVVIGADTIVDSHARIGHQFGKVEIGQHNHIQTGAVLGGPAQDLGHTGEDTRLVIGHFNRIGEYVSISQGTAKDSGETKIGDHTMLMAFVHIGHDCHIGNNVIITNATQLAGHVRVEDHALLSGLAGVSQFVRLGRYSFLTGGSFVNKDIPPYTIAQGHWATLRAVNRIGLKRAGVDPEIRHSIEAAVRILLDKRLTIEEVRQRIVEECKSEPEVDHLVDFLGSSSRGIAKR